MIEAEGKQWISSALVREWLPLLLFTATFSFIFVDAINTEGTYCLINRCVREACEDSRGCLITCPEGITPLLRQDHTGEHQCLVAQGYTEHPVIPPKTAALNDKLTILGIILLSYALIIRTRRLLLKDRQANNQH